MENKSGSDHQVDAFEIKWKSGEKFGDLEVRTLCVAGLIVRQFTGSTATVTIAGGEKYSLVNSYSPPTSLDQVAVRCLRLEGSNCAEEQWTVFRVAMFKETFLDDHCKRLNVYSIGTSAGLCGFRLML